MPPKIGAVVQVQVDDKSQKVRLDEHDPTINTKVQWKKMHEAPDSFTEELRFDKAAAAVRLRASGPHGTAGPWKPRSAPSLLMRFASRTKAPIWPRRSWPASVS
jgi:hypothetical protein